MLGHTRDSARASFPLHTNVVAPALVRMLNEALLQSAPPMPHRIVAMGGREAWASTVAVQGEHLEDEDFVFLHAHTFAPSLLYTCKKVARVPSGVSALGQASLT